MNIYHIWFDLKPGTSEIEFSEKMSAFLNRLKDKQALETWRLTRCKLGLSPDDIGEFHIMIETRDLTQLDTAFKALAPKTGEMHELHFGANAFATNLKFALYRDWPDVF